MTILRYRERDKLFFFGFCEIITETMVHCGDIEGGGYFPP